MSVFRACVRLVRQAAHKIDAARRDTVYVPQHGAPRETLVECPACGTVFTPFAHEDDPLRVVLPPMVSATDARRYLESVREYEDRHRIPESELRLLWGDR